MPPWMEAAGTWSRPGTKPSPGAAASPTLDGAPPPRKASRGQPTWEARRSAPQSGGVRPPVPRSRQPCGVWGRSRRDAHPDGPPDARAACASHGGTTFEAIRIEGGWAGRFETRAEQRLGKAAQGEPVEEEPDEPSIREDGPSRTTGHRPGPRNESRLALRHRGGAGQATPVGAEFFRCGRQGPRLGAESHGEGGGPLPGRPRELRRGDRARRFPGAWRDRPGRIELSLHPRCAGGSSSRQNARLFPAIKLWCARAPHLFGPSVSWRAGERTTSIQTRQKTVCTGRGFLVPSPGLPGSGSWSPGSPPTFGMGLGGAETAPPSTAPRTQDVPARGRASWPSNEGGQ